MVKEFTINDILNKSLQEQCEVCWYDWFCRNSSLLNKTKKLIPKARRISKSTKINPDTMSIWFKNNCPLVGKLYDDIRFSDLTTGETVYCVVPSSGFKSNFGRSEVWGKENDFQGPLVRGPWKDVLDFFGV